MPGSGSVCVSQGQGWGKQWLDVMSISFEDEYSMPPPPKKKRGHKDPIFTPLVIFLTGWGSEAM